MTRNIHKVYNELDTQSRVVVDQSFHLLMRHLIDSGLYVSVDDRAERLIEAISVYVKESNQR